MFGWHASFEHRYFKSRRDEYRVRIWKPVKYKRLTLSQRVSESNLIFANLVDRHYKHGLKDGETLVIPLTSSLEPLNSTISDPRG